MNDVEFHWSSGMVVGTLQLMRLVDRNLRILVTMKEQQGRIGSVDVSDWTGEFCHIWDLVWQAAQEPRQCRTAYAQTEGC